MTKMTFAILAVPATAICLFAQGGGQVMVAQGAVGAIAFPDQPAVHYFTQEFTFNGRTVTGQPYSADEKTESVQSLADGTHITNTTTTRVYRDGEGRTRREMSMPALPGDSKPHLLISISDPVAGVSYTLDPETKTAHQGPMMGYAFEAKLKAERAAQTMAMTAPGPVTTKSEVRIIRSDKSANVKREDLGTNVIDGVNVKGSRETSVIDVGEIGNDRPITITNERWFAPDLQIEVKSVHSDPRMGDTTHTVTNINRTEPDPSLFQVPSDYKLEQGPKPMQTFHVERVQ